MIDFCMRNIQAGNITAPLNEALDTICSITDSNLLNQFKIYADLGGARQAVDEIISELGTKPKLSNVESDLRKLLRNESSSPNIRVREVKRAEYEICRAFLR